MRSKKALTEFFRPTKWKILAVVLFYFSNFISFFGLIFNSPMYWLFYWGKPTPMGTEGFVLFLIHIGYLYLLSCIFIKLLS